MHFDDEAYYQESALLATVSQYLTLLKKKKNE
jgi:hypothetical protein